jgi:hypothetical protein
VSFGSKAVNTSGVQSLNFTGLSGGTAYFAHYLHTDAALNDSNILTADGFTTPDVTAPILSSPVAAQSGTTTGTGQVNTNEGNGTLYF